MNINSNMDLSVIWCIITEHEFVLHVFFLFFFTCNKCTNVHIIFSKVIEVLHACVIKCIKVHEVLVVDVT